jgi:hypothetical protein
MRVNRPEAEIVLKALNFWVCRSKMTRSNGILISAWSFRSYITIVDPAIRENAGWSLLPETSLA